MGNQLAKTNTIKHKYKISHKLNRQPNKYASTKQTHRTNNQQQAKTKQMKPNETKQNQATPTNN